MFLDFASPNHQKSSYTPVFQTYPKVGKKLVPWRVKIYFNHHVLFGSCLFCASFPGTFETLKKGDGNSGPCFIFSPNLGEMIQFLKKHQLVMGCTKDTEVLEEFGLDAFLNGPNFQHKTSSSRSKNPESCRILVM